MQKILFLVPHEDDELFVGGAMLINLIRSEKYDPYVFIATNGDYYPSENEIRTRESLDVLYSIGMKKENIIFGGYGDCWQGTHIYNSPDDEKKISQGGFKKTYAANSEYQEWHSMKYGESQYYSRSGYLHDLKDLITDLHPDIIICVDLDFHRDHKCLSLLTEEALGLVLKENPPYRPTVLKKYAYQGVLSGEKDYFHVPHYPTVNNSDSTSNPYFSWQDRIRYQVPKDCDTFFLRNNLLYKLIRKYKTQDVWTSASGFINSDIVYWKRNTNNLALTATIQASSGDPHWLNDFKLVDTDDVTPRKSDYTTRCWRPNSDDMQKEIRVSFSESQTIQKIILYFNNLDGILPGFVNVKLFDNNAQLLCEKVIPNLKSGIYSEMIEFEKANQVMSVLFDINDDTCQIGLGEIEIIGKEEDVPFQEFLYTGIEMNSPNSIKNKLENSIQKIDELIFKTQCYAYRNMKKHTKNKEF